MLENSTVEACRERPGSGSRTATFSVREVRRPNSRGVAGGLIDPGETAADDGRREVRAETAIEREIGVVASVHRATRRH